MVHAPAVTLVGDPPDIVDGLPSIRQDGRPDLRAAQVALGFAGLAGHRRGLRADHGGHAADAQVDRVLAELASGSTADA